MIRILITGGTGSFGGAAVKRFLSDSKVSEIIIFSRDEMKQYVMKNEYNNPKLTFVVGDVRDRDAIQVASRGVDFIFHAAALKHVPTGECFPMEMIKTNIIGTENVLLAAEENGVKKVVFLSTDKAAYPVCAMGISKNMAEKLVNSHSRTSKGTVFCTVRFGNIMASRGSVSYFFAQLAKINEPITVTNPNMTRFMLSLDDAIKLVELAMKKGEQGDIFVMKAPAVAMVDFAQAIINIFKSKSKIKLIGARAGEKIHETLVTSLELVRTEDLGDYYRIKDGINFAKNNKGVVKIVKDDYTSQSTKQLSVIEMEKLLRSLDGIKSE